MLITGYWGNGVYLRGVEGMMGVPVRSINSNYTKENDCQIRMGYWLT